MKVSNTVPTCPDDGQRIHQPVSIAVESHWNFTDRVHLVFGPPGNPCTITVLADDLQRAIKNATNHKG